MQGVVPYNDCSTTNTDAYIQAVTTPAFIVQEISQKEQREGEAQEPRGRGKITQQYHVELDGRRKSTRQ